MLVSTPTTRIAAPVKLGMFENPEKNALRMELNRTFNETGKKLTLAFHNNFAGLPDDADTLGVVREIIRQVQTRNLGIYRIEIESGAVVFVFDNKTATIGPIMEMIRSVFLRTGTLFVEVDC